MNKEILYKHTQSFLKKIQTKEYDELFGIKERQDHVSYYKSFLRDKILMMNEEQLYEYTSKLWAMLIWGNKHYVVDKIINDNGFEYLKKELANLVWGEDPIENRWDRFRRQIKGMGPVMMSEILYKTHSDV